MEALFVYGTLKDPAVQLLVIGRVIPGTPDTLDGFRKTEIDLGVVYPILVSDPAGSVEGVVLELTPEELARTDRYETDAYRRLRVTLRSGREAWVYAK